MSFPYFSETFLVGILQERFGLTAFRGAQYPVIRKILAGEDVLALMPTGAGKSLCYQLPALVMPGVTLVITPLIALMRDQVRRLHALNIPSYAVIASEDLQREMNQLARPLKKGQIKIILTSPERIQIAYFLQWLENNLPPEGLALLVIDEAHCIAEWGHEFRPAYRELSDFRNRYPHTPVLAMTASADQSIKKEILRVMQMTEQSVIQTSFNRPELFYKVGHATFPWRSVIAYLQHYHAHHPAIFYCAMRHETEQLASLLRSCGFHARAYHAGMNSEERGQAEQWFLESDHGVMVATIAFGMGMDKPNIRLIAHVGHQHKLASYYQETGRAGRDGVQSDVLLMLSHREYDLITKSECQLDPISDDHSSQVYFAAFIRNKQCRRIALLSGLDERFEGNCNACDHCVPQYRPIPRFKEHASVWVPKSQ